MNKLIATVVAIVSLSGVLCAADTVSTTDSSPVGHLNLTLSGNGLSDLKTHDNGIGVTLGLSQEGLVWEPLEAGVRQSIAYQSEGNDVQGRTALFGDWNVPVAKKLVAFVGWQADGTYGQGTSFTWRTGPEGGLKLFVADNAYLFGRVNYDLKLNGNAGDSVAYTLGIGLRF
jgi:hypothetical protein